MPTPGERKALLFLGAVVALGAGARGAAVLRSAAPVDAAARSALETQIQTVDSARRGKSKRKGKGRKKSSRAVDQASDAARAPAPRYVDPQPVVPAIVDLDVASSAEIETLRISATKADLAVETLALVWVPAQVGAAGAIEWLCPALS